MKFVGIYLYDLSSQQISHACLLVS